MRVKDLFFVVNGATPSSKVQQFWDGDITWITPADMNDFGKIFSGETNISQLGYDSCGTIMCPINSIIISKRAPIGKVNIAQTEYCTNQGCCSLVPKSKHIDSLFYAYYLFNNKKDLEMLGQGTTFNEISYRNIVSYPVPEKSLTEQKAIAKYLDEKIEAIDTNINIRTSELRLLEELKKSEISTAVMRGLTPDVSMKESGVSWLGLVPKHWEIKRMKDVAYLYSGLTGKSGDDFKSEETKGSRPYIPFTNVLNNMVIDPKLLQYVNISDNEHQNIVKRGDIIFLMSSEDYESIAKSSVVEDDLGEVYLNSFCRGLRINQKVVYPKFLNYLLSGVKYRDALRFEARGFTRINIKIDKIASQIICIPPHTEQREIAEYLDARISKIDMKITAINKQVKVYERLKRSLIDEIVTGKKEIL